jgi:hypothetical protein
VPHDIFDERASAETGSLMMLLCKCGTVDRLLALSTGASGGAALPGRPGQFAQINFGRVYTTGLHQLNSSFIITPYHRPVHVPECALLTVQYLSFGAFAFFVHSVS